MRNLKLESAEFIHLIEETVKFCVRKKMKKVALISTTGTRKTNVYQNVVKALGIKLEIIQVEESNQGLVHDCIYDEEYGVKANSACTEAVKNLLLSRIIPELQAKGATAVILGCTEFPTAFAEITRCPIETIDPMEIAAKAIISASKN